MIVALAGHVDHGKTALIQALTGIDADRLPEEKLREMTIDLGFAYLRLSDTETIGFVDVPGHERFLVNMLAGVLSIHSVLLVIAADDGPMPQTHEHLAILRLTGVADLTVVVTKTDRVDAAGLARMLQTIRMYLARGGYPAAAIFPASSRTGEGIAELRDFLTAKATATPPNAPSGGFRMSIDRTFTVAGAGLVVTGTVTSGTVRAGDRLVVSPAHLSARVRGIQVHHASAPAAAAGDRCALAIVGAELEKATLHRGDWLLAPALHAPTQRVDALIRTTEDRKLRHAARVHVHLGSASLGARAVLLQGDDLAADQEGFVSLALDRPTAALYGDRIVLRDDATGRVVAGGRIVDPFTPLRRSRREQRVVSLRAHALADPAAALSALLTAEGWVDLRRFELARNLEEDSIAADSVRRLGRAARPVLAANATQEAIARALLSCLTSWHNRHPERIGPDKRALLAGAAGWPVEIAEAVLLDLLTAARVMRQDAAFRLPDHNPALPPLDEAYWTRIEKLLDRTDLRPPRVRELAEALTLPPDATEALLIRLERFGRLLRVAPNRFFPPRIVIELGSIAEQLSEDGGFTAAQFNSRSGIGRNLTIAVLEFLDKIGVTQRKGELRHILRPVAEVLG